MRVGAERTRASRDPERRHEELLDAAVRVFKEKGLHQTTVAEITAAAGVAKGTFYLYFSSKEHLLGALKERYVDELISGAEELFQRAGRDDWWALADETVTRVIDFMLRHRDMIQVFAQESPTQATNELFAECVAKLHRMFALGIQAGTAAGAYAVPDPDLAASFLQHAVHGSVVHAILYDDEVDRDRLLEAAKALTRKVLAP